MREGTLSRGSEPESVKMGGLWDKPEVGICQEARAVIRHEGTKFDRHNCPFRRSAQQPVGTVRTWGKGRASLLGFSTYPLPTSPFSG